MEACSSVKITTSFPSTYHDEVAQNGSKVAVLRDILCQHYNIQKVGMFNRDVHNIINQRVENESIERCIGGTDIIKEIVWRHYGYTNCPTLSNHTYTKREKLHDPVVRQQRISEYETQQKVPIIKPIKKQKAPKVKPIKKQKITKAKSKLIKKNSTSLSEYKLKEIEQGRLEREELYQKCKTIKDKPKKQPKKELKPKKTQPKKIREEATKRINEELEREKQQERIEQENKKKQAKKELEKAKQDREYQREVNKNKLEYQLSVEWRNWGRQLSKIQKKQLSQSVSENRAVWLERDKKREIKKKQEKEQTERIKQEKELLQDKRGIEKYYSPDLNNHVDQEIVRRIKDNSQTFVGEERICRSIMSHGLRLGIGSKDKKRIDAEILLGIEKRCKRYNKGWNETIRELFCIEFNIKPLNDSKTDLKVTQETKV
jgi:hypothetical protein